MSIKRPFTLKSNTNPCKFHFLSNSKKKHENRFMPSLNMRHATKCVLHVIGVCSENSMDHSVFNVVSMSNSDNFMLLYTFKYKST